MPFSRSDGAFSRVSNNSTLMVSVTHRSNWTVLLKQKSSFGVDDTPSETCSGMLKCWMVKGIRIGFWVQFEWVETGNFIHMWTLQTLSCRYSTHNFTVPGNGSMNTHVTTWKWQVHELWPQTANNTTTLLRHWHRNTWTYILLKPENPTCHQL